MLKKTATLLLLSLLLISEANAQVLNNAAGLTLKDPYTLLAKKSLLDGYSALTQDGFVNVVVEIPTGSADKWEVTKPAGHLAWEIKEGRPRIVKYLGYPGNYGMVPRTLGGDGDALDVIVLGPAVARGSVVAVKIIGVLKMHDKGEQDDKLIGVLAGSHFEKIDSLKELNKKFNGVSLIIETWFANYKGQKKIKIDGYAGVAKAQKILRESIDAYKKKHPGG